MSQGVIPPPPGQIVMLEGSPSFANEFVVWFSVCVAVSGLFIAIRTYARIVVSKKFGFEDGFLITSWTLSLAYLLTGLPALPYGGGEHLWNVTREDFSNFTRLWNVPMVLYNPAICLVKLAILMQIKRLFVVNRGKMYWTIIALIIITVVFYFACMMLRILVCYPRERIWNPSVPGTCINSTITVIISASLNVAMDVVMLILPVSRVWSLRIPIEKKWIASIVFLPGILGVGASIARLVMSLELNNSRDSTYGLLINGLWCEVEITSGIICCCLPNFPGLWRFKIKPMWFGAAIPGISYPSQCSGQNSGPYSLVPVESRSMNKSLSVVPLTDRGVSAAESLPSPRDPHVSLEDGLASEETQYTTNMHTLNEWGTSKR